MRKITTLLFVVPLLSSCTAIGFVTDHVNNNKKQKRADSISEPNQEIVLQNKEGNEISGTFSGFSYQSKELNDASYKQEVTFPQLGDSIFISIENGKRTDGYFSGIMHSQEQNNLIFKPSQRTNRLKYLDIEKIHTLSNSSLNLLIEHPIENKILIHIDDGSTLSSIPLSEVKHLNQQIIERKYTGTILGILADTMITLLVINSLNNMDFSGMW